MIWTEGVKDFADHAGGGAYWLLDILATEPAILGLVKQQGIAFATLAVADGKGLLTVVQDEGQPPVFSRAFSTTDCPEGDWMFYLAQTELDGGVGTVILLPSEY